MDARIRMAAAQGAPGSTKTFVLVSDSISTAVPPGEEQAITGGFKRYGDLILRDMAAYGIDRRLTDWNTNTGQTVTLAYGSAPADFIYRDMAVSGSRAATYLTTQKATKATQANAWSSPVDYLIVQLGYNDCAASVSAWATYQTNLTARLNDWTNVAYKFALLSWLPATGTNLTNWVAAFNAGAAAATPGYRQTSIPAFIYGGAGGATRPNVVNALSYDGVHLNEAGHRAYYETFAPQIAAALP